MTETPSRATVLDTSVLSNFAHVDRVELLLDLPRLTTVEAVRAELEAGAETHPYLRNALEALDGRIPVISPGPRVRELEARYLQALDPGEAQVLALAEASGGTAVTDDGDARARAKRRNVAVTGSIGLLVRFVEGDRLSTDAADSYLKRWIDEAGFRSPARDVEVFIQD